MSVDIIKAIIVDDEPKVSLVLEHELKESFPEVKILAIARSVKEAIGLINTYKPELVFLDIVMPEENGFELLKYFERIDFELIFVTSHSEFALNAIKVSALAYLLKPVEKTELKEAIELVKTRIGLKDTYKNYKVLLENMSKEVPGEQIIAINNLTGVSYVKINDIICCEGWDRYTKIHLLNDKELISSYSVGKFRSILESYSFIHCHRSYLINPKHVLSIDQNDHINMVKNIKVPLAVRKKQEIIEFLVSQK